jgi:NagD protein
MAMARKTGAVGALVLTGEATASEAAAMRPPPDFVLPSIAELGELLAIANRQRRAGR